MKRILLLVSVGILYSCSTSSTNDENSLFEGRNGNDNPTSQNSEWSIPISEVIDGGPGKDGIPALVNPTFTNAQEANYLKDSDLIIGFKNGDVVRAYPHAILDWHEIVNDNLNDVSVAITFCPLTGTGIGWSRVIQGEETTFGVSGLLYNTNLIPYDRATGSNWSQLLNESVNGSLIGEKANLIGLFETDWKTWKTIYPNTQVLSLDTGFSRTYGTSPYGDYNTNNDRFLFPVFQRDRRLPLKQRVHAILNENKAKVYTFSNFQSNNIIKDSFFGKNYLIVGNEKFIVSFELNNDLSNLNFQYVFNGSEILLNDNEGNQWNIFGEGISGPRKGQHLGNASSFMGMWFSFAAFYETEIYKN